MKTIYKNARFTCLAPGLLRMEYSPNGTFEDRNSVRIIDRPAEIDFKDSQIEKETCTLSTGQVNLVYRDDPFTSDAFYHWGDCWDSFH